MALSSHDKASDEKAGGTSSSSSSIPHVKFPRTTHIFDAGGSGVTRDDLVLSKGDAKVFYSGLVVGVVSERQPELELRHSCNPPVMMMMRMMIMMTSGGED